MGGLSLSQEIEGSRSRSDAYPLGGWSGTDDVVRLTGLELADQKRSRPPRGELTPFSDRGSTVLLEDAAAVEVSVLVEVVVERGMDGSELLKGLHVPGRRHRPLSSSERLMRVFGPVVEPATADPSGSVTDHRHRRTA